MCTPICRFVLHVQNRRKLMPVPIHCGTSSVRLIPYMGNRHAKEMKRVDDYPKCRNIRCLSLERSLFASSMRLCGECAPFPPVPEMNTGARNPLSRTSTAGLGHGDEQEVSVGTTTAGIFPAVAYAAKRREWSGPDLGRALFAREPKCGVASERRRRK